MADKKKYRRSNGEGSVFRHNNGKWCGQIALGIDENGKRTRRTVYGETRAEVVEKLAVLRGSIDAHKLKPSLRTTVGQFIEKWLKDFKRPTVTPRTYEWYMNVNKNISDEIKDTLLHKANAYQIQTMLNAMKNEGYSVRTIKAAYDLLNQAFKAAVEFHMIGENPMDKVKVQRKETKRKQKALDAETRKKAMEVIDGNEVYKPIVYTMIGMGLRIGETIALKWSDVDFKNNTLSVNKAAKATPEVNDNGEITGRSMEISGTKTVCSVRTLPMPEVVREALKEWQKVYFQRFKASETDNLVFPNKDGKLRSYSGFRRQFGRFLNEKGLENITFHQFRHTFATMMLERGVNPRVVQEFLGHKDISTTLGIYTGVTSDVMKAAADGADTALRGMDSL
jgi:integrase